MNEIRLGPVTIDMQALTIYELAELSKALKAEAARRSAGRRNATERDTLGDTENALQ